VKKLIFLFVLVIVLIITGSNSFAENEANSSLLRITAGVFGRIFIHNQENALVVDMNKIKGRVVELVLDAGDYRLINVRKRRILESRISISEGETVELGLKDFMEEERKVEDIPRDTPGKYKPMVFKKRGNRLNFFGAYVSKFTRAYNDSALMSGIHFGITFNRSFSFGFAGYANMHDFPMGHPTFWGLTLEYAWPSRSMFNLKTGILLGSGEECLLDRYFYILEPQVGITFNITRLFNVGLGVSYRYTSLKKSNLAPFSLCFSARLGK
jgi:hypothetical protein